MHISPLDAPFGARLHLDSEGVGGAPLDAEASRTLRALFDEHELLVVREGEIPAERQIALLEPLGRIEPDESGRPMQMEVTNQHAETTAPDGELVFHYDYAYDPQPIPGISMYGAVVGEGATSTLFASSSRVLDRLSSPTLDRLRGLEAAHACFLQRPDAPGERSREPDPIIARGQPGWGAEHYWTHHPVLWENASGKPTLFVCLQHTDRILGLSRSESDALLEELYAALYDPAHVYEHVWQPNDLVIWDNFTVQHARPEPNDVPRTLRRFHLSETDLTADYLRVAREHGYV